VTKAPMFTAADEAGAPPLKPGVWILFMQPGCKVDVRTPTDTWPDCAGGGRVEPGKISGHDSKKPKGVWDSMPFTLAAGAPRIAQVQIKQDLSVSADADQSSATDSKSQIVYGYVAVKPTKTDAAGQITAVSYWMVLCGPPPPKNKDGSDAALGTLKPLPGMQMKPGDAVCVPASKEAIRGAGKASEAWKDTQDQAQSEAHWLRDGDK
jgi:hypothetical protein